MRRIGYKTINSIFVSLFICLLFISCDSPTGSDINPEDRPDIPTLEEIEMDISYFQNNQPPQGESGNDEYQNYLQARSVALEINSELTNLLSELVELQVHNTNFGGGHPIEDLWRWFITYNFDYNPEVGNDFLGYHLGLLEVLVLAEVDEPTQKANWEVYVSGCIDGEEVTEISDPCFEYNGAGPDDTFEFSADFKLMEGDVSIDQTNGEWNLFSPYEPGSNPPYINIEWVFSSNDNRTFTVSVTEDALLILNIAYSETNGDYRMDISGSSIESQTVIGWDMGLHEGYLERSNQQQAICWNSDLENRNC